MGRYFGTDGIRGRANEGLSAERAFLVGRYLGYYFSKDGRHSIIIGKDTRLSSSMLENALAAGIASEGCDAYLAGYCPTPMIAYLTRVEDFACGAMISASHNPFYDNGIKIFSKEGIKLSADIEGLIEDYIDGLTEIEYRVDAEIGHIEEYPKGIEDYLNWVKKEINLDLTGFKVAMDCANGSSTFTAPRLIEELGAEVYVMHNEPNGTNINTQCGSTHPEQFIEFMKEHPDYDLGLMFDGDADRQIMVSPLGNQITGDHVLYVTGKYYRDLGKLNHNTIVTTVMANLGLFKAMEREGIKVASTQVGDKYVYEQMCKEDDIIGGEQSGHIIFKHHETTGDGLITALIYLKIMKETGKTAEQLLEGLKIYPQLLVNVRVKNKDQAMNDPEVKAAISEVNVSLNGNGRILVRPSGTEPLVRVMAEAETDEICKYEVEKVVGVVKSKFGAD